VPVWQKRGLHIFAQARGCWEVSNETIFDEEEKKRRSAPTPIATESLSRSSGRNVRSRDNRGGAKRDELVEDRALSTPFAPTL